MFKRFLAVEVEGFSSGIYALVCSYKENHKELMQSKFQKKVHFLNTKTSDKLRADYIDMVIHSNGSCLVLNRTLEEKLHKREV